MNLAPILQTAGRLLAEGINHGPCSVRKRFSRIVSAQGRYWFWLGSLYMGPPTVIHGTEKLTVVLQSYLRPFNMDRLVRAAAHCAFVDNIILSNNNPMEDMGQYLKFRDPRLKLVQNRVRRYAGFRWSLARETMAEYVIALDDDVFIRPYQIARLFERLIEAPEVPHGLFGTRYRNEPGTDPAERRNTERHVVRREEEVDVLHRVYAVHRKRVEDYFRLLEDLRIVEPLTAGDDIIMSLASPGRPRVHDLGPVLSCPTSRKAEIAVHQGDHFFRTRQTLYRACRGLRPRSPAGRGPRP